MEKRREVSGNSSACYAGCDLSICNPNSLSLSLACHRFSSAVHLLHFLQTKAPLTNLSAAGRAVVELRRIGCIITQTRAAFLSQLPFSPDALSKTPAFALPHVPCTCRTPSCHQRSPYRLQEARYHPQ